MSLIGNFVTSIKKVYVRSRLRGFACACQISTSRHYSVELVVLNEHQISGGEAYLDCCNARALFL